MALIWNCLCAWLNQVVSSTAAALELTDIRDHSIRHTVACKSIDSSWHFSHFVALQPVIKMDFFLDVYLSPPYGSFTFVVCANIVPVQEKESYEYCSENKLMQV